MKAYNVNDIIDNMLAHDYEYTQLFLDLIESLKHDMNQHTINHIRTILYDLPSYIRHHIDMRLELFEDMINGKV